MDCPGAQRDFFLELGSHGGVEMLDESLFERAASLLHAVDSLVALTGAGVSAESGVPTFHGEGGVWKGFRAEEVATPEAFARDPKLVWDFYNDRRELLTEIKPNPAHHVLADLERRYRQFTLVTQNIDGLHALAGSKNVLELHGNLWHVRCTGCGKYFDKTRQKLPELPSCELCGALLRPDVVWFGETLPEDVWNEAHTAVAACGVLLVVGTSAVVYPAAGLVDLARQHGAKVIEVNLELTAASQIAEVCLHAKAGEVLPVLLEKLESCENA